MLITMSISSAPSRREASVSATLALVVVAPSGKPETTHTFTGEPFNSAATAFAQNGFTQTLANSNWSASAQTCRTSSLVASGFRMVWSIRRAIDRSKFMREGWKQPERLPYHTNRKSQSEVSALPRRSLNTKALGGHQAASCAVQKAQRLAPIVISLRHSGHFFVVGSAGGSFGGRGASGLPRQHHHVINGDRDDNEGNDGIHKVAQQKLAAVDGELNGREIGLARDCRDHRRKKVFCECSDDAAECRADHHAYGKINNVAAQ